MSTVEFVRRATRLAAIAVAAMVLSALMVVPQTSTAHADAAGRGGDYAAFTTVRTVLDTRTGIGGVTGVRGARSVTTFQVLGVGGIPTTGVSAVFLRLAAIGPTANTYYTAWPDGTAQPSVAMLNVMTGQTLSNTAIVRPGANGKISIFNYGGTTHVLAEVHGYFTTSTGATSGGYVPVTQTRAIDTRTGVGTTTGAIPAGGSRVVNLAIAGVPAGASAVFAAVTMPPPTATGYIQSMASGVTTAGITLLDYENGINNASGAAITLGVDGRVTFVNKGTAAAHLILDIMGYATRTATAGAGLRPVTARLHGGTVAANATIDIAVGGTHGLPTRGIAGAALSLQAAAGAANGTLRVWPTGAAEPITSSTQFSPGTTQRSSVVVRPGTDGKVRLRNISAAPITLYADLEGWFSDPQPSLPVAQNSPVSVVQAPPTGGQLVGALEYAYVDNIGRVVIGHQENLDNFSTVQYTVISGNEAFTGRPALNPKPDGAIGVFAQYADGGDTWTSGQTAPRAATWLPWTDLGGSMAAPPAAITQANGTTALFAVDADGKLWTYGTSWRNLGDANLTGTPAVVAVRDGVQVFARDDTGTVVTLLHRPDGTTTPWTNLGGTGAGTPSVVVYPGYRLRIFAQAADGTVTTKQQDINGVFPTAWDTIGGLVMAGVPSAILDPQLGRTAVVVRATDGLIHASFETTSGSGVFGDWSPVNTPDLAAATDPTTTPVNNGSTALWIITYRTTNGTVVVYERRGIPGLAANTSAFAKPELIAPLR